MHSLFVFKIDHLYLYLILLLDKIQITITILSHYIPIARTIKITSIILTNLSNS